MSSPPSSSSKAAVPIIAAVAVGGVAVALIGGYFLGKYLTEKHFVCPECPVCPDCPDCPVCPDCDPCDDCPDCPDCDPCDDCPDCPDCDVAPEPRKYNFYPGLNAAELKDLAFVKYAGWDVKKLKAGCDAFDSATPNAQCVVFNSDAWLSSRLLPMEKWFAASNYFSKRKGTFIADEYDPQSERNSPGEPWVWFPGCNLDGVLEPVEVTTGTVEELKAHAASLGYVGFSSDGNMYAALPAKDAWNVGSQTSLYVLRDNMPEDGKLYGM
jgi:hypothetical protein